MRIQKIPCIVYLCLLPLLITLGFWQLHRAEEKQILMNSQKKAAKTETLQLSISSNSDIDSIRYQTVIAQGHYDAHHQFLIDNQIKGGKVGYFVLTPLILKDEKIAILVNRGWLPLNQDRRILPEVKVPEHFRDVEGRVNRFPSVGIKLAGAEIPTDAWPSVVQVVDSEILAKKLGYPLFNFQMELNNNAPDGFIREWQTPPPMQPEQHQAYAIQWFALALTLTIGFIVFSIKKINE
ncbi:MAG: SURF1 family protein [Methylococcaceae bacterium]|nr:SURF1 family protein [Methylococcaceae bacterium]